MTNAQIAREAKRRLKEPMRLIRCGHCRKLTQGPPVGVALLRMAFPDYLCTHCGRDVCGPKTN